MSKKPNVLVLTGFGLNCDHETAYAFELAGATAERAHINALIAKDVSL
jgi:phosphoribosylformylglycinamidine (FGAM) synthase-like amidotransferase family enzyme